ncbi:MAG TPA: hypothetical protein DD730_07495 [Desulfosporosinus sp.]|nr:hypothetical protein [Desulfosporosinus sp.]
MPKVALVILSALVLIFVVFVSISMIANDQFNRKVDKGVTAFYSGVENKHEVIRQTDLERLPQPVQNWLQYSQVVGKERIVAARTKHDVTMRLKENQPWLKAQAEQYFRTDEPGFIWAVDIKMAPLVHIVGKDQYIDGRGNMLIKLLSLINVVNASGKEIDQGTLLRYLSEIMLVPTAALSDTIQWEGIDSNSAKATMSYKGVTASGVFTFNEKGEILNFVAQRYGDFEGGYRLETWCAEITEYKEFNGFKVASKGDIIWKLKTGDYHWYHFEVKEIEYNVS